MYGCAKGSCNGCYSAACENRQSGFGLYYPTKDENGGSVGAVSSGGLINQLTGAALSFVPGGNAIGALITGIGSLFGAAPRGNFEKFKRTAYPYMRTLAAKSAIPVTIGWFGDVVMVKPDGSFGVIAPQTAGYEQSIIALGYHPFYAATCLRPDNDCVNNPHDLGWALFDPYNESSSIVRGSQAASIPAGSVLPTIDVPVVPVGDGGVNQAGMLSGGMNPWLVMSALGLAVVLFTNKKGGR